MAKICKQCGSEIEQGKKFCTECGASANEALEKEMPKTDSTPKYTYTQTQQTYTQQPQSADPDAPPPKGSKYEVVTTKEFIGISLLMLIPIVNIVLLIVWALGGCRKINKRNMARASLIMMVITLIISLLVGMAVKALFNKALEEAGLSFENGQFVVEENSDSEIGRLLGTISDFKNGEMAPEDIAGLLGVVTGEEFDTSQFEEMLGSITGEDGQIDMSQLEEILGQLEEISGEGAEE